MCVREFLEGVNRGGRYTSNMVGASLWAVAPDWIRGKSELNPSIHLSQSIFMLLPPCLLSCDGPHPQSVSQSKAFLLRLLWSGISSQQQEKQFLWLLSWIWSSLTRTCTRDYIRNIWPLLDSYMIFKHLLHCLFTLLMMSFGTFDYCDI